jgi:hypothetical protein
MRNKKVKETHANPTRISVEQEMAKPRMARSARMAELNLDSARIPEQPSASVPRTVAKLIPSLCPNEMEKAQIVVDEADQGYRDLRIENMLTDEHGDVVKLKKGAHVKVTVIAEPKT